MDDESGSAVWRDPGGGFGLDNSNIMLPNETYSLGNKDYEPLVNGIDDLLLNAGELAYDDNEDELFETPALTCFDESGKLLEVTKIAISSAASELREPSLNSSALHVEKSLVEDTQQHLDELRELLELTKPLSNTETESPRDEFFEYKQLVEEATKRTVASLRNVERIKSTIATECDEEDEYGNKESISKLRDSEVTPPDGGLLKLYTDAILERRKKGEWVLSSTLGVNEGNDIETVDEDTKTASNTKDQSNSSDKAEYGMEMDTQHNDLLNDDYISEVRQKLDTDVRRWEETDLKAQEELQKIQEQYKHVDEDVRVDEGDGEAENNQVQIELRDESKSLVGKLDASQGSSNRAFENLSEIWRSDQKKPDEKLQTNVAKKLEEELARAREERIRLDFDLQRKKQLELHRKQMMEEDHRAREMHLHAKQREEEKITRLRIREIQLVKFRLIEQRCKEQMALEDKEAKLTQQLQRRLRLAKEEAERRRLEEQRIAEEKQRQEDEARKRHEDEVRRMEAEQRALKAERQRQEEAKKIRELEEAERKEHERKLRLALHRRMMQRADKHAKLRQVEWQQTKRMEIAAICLQKYWRARKARCESRKIRWELMKKNSHASRIQSIVRGWLVRNRRENRRVMETLKSRVVRIMEVRSKAVTTIQALWRGTRVRLRMKKARERGLDWDGDLSLELPDIDPSLFEFDAFVVPDFSDMVTLKTSSSVGMTKDSSHRNGYDEQLNSLEKTILKSSLDKLGKSIRPKLEPLPQSTNVDTSVIAIANSDDSKKQIQASVGGVPMHFLHPSEKHYASKSNASLPSIRMPTELQGTSSLTSARKQAQEELSARAQTPQGTTFTLRNVDASGKIASTQEQNMSTRRPHSSSSIYLPDSNQTPALLPPLTRPMYEGKPSRPSSTSHGSSADQKYAHEERRKSILNHGNDYDGDGDNYDEDNYDGDDYSDDEDLNEGSTGDLVAKAVSDLRNVSNMNVNSKGSKQVEDNDWGIKDPRTLAALRKKKNRLVKMKKAKEESALDATRRLERFQRNAFVPKSTATHFSVPTNKEFAGSESKSGRSTPSTTSLDGAAWSTPVGNVSKVQSVKASDRGGSVKEQMWKENTSKNTTLKNSIPIPSVSPTPHNNQIQQHLQQTRNTAPQISPSIGNMVNLTQQLSAHAFNAFMMQSYVPGEDNQRKPPDASMANSVVRTYKDGANDSMELYGNALGQDRSLPSSLTQFRVSRR